MHCRCCRRIGALVTGAVVLIGTAGATAQPTVQGFAGTIEPDQQITVTGSGFGEGPNVILFDDFRSAQPGGPHPTQAVIGQWQTAQAVGYADGKLSNGVGIRVIKDGGGALGSRMVFPEPSGEVFTSFVGYVPDGFKFPSAVAEETLPRVSALKMAWLMDGAKGYNSLAGSDYVLGGYGGGLYRISSNDRAGPSRFDIRRNIGWAWDTPVRFAYWLKGNGTESVGSDGLFQATNGREQVSDRYTDYKPWFTPVHARHVWDRLHFVGYVRGGPGKDPVAQPASAFEQGHNFVMDDIYVAIGPNACARVEIGNASTYAACTRLTLVTTGGSDDRWTPTSITATIRQGVMSEQELRSGYLYVTDGQGRVNPTGLPLGDADAPLP